MKQEILSKQMGPFLALEGSLTLSTAEVRSSLLRRVRLTCPILAGTPPAFSLNGQTEHFTSFRGGPICYEDS